VTDAGLFVRWAHLTSGVILLGTFTVLALTPRRRPPTAERWEREALGLARVCVLVALAAGLGALAIETARFEGRAGAALDSQALGRTLGATRFGTVWIVREGLLLLLAAFALLAVPGRAAADRLALYLECALLSAGALVAVAWAGHAAAVDPASLPALSADACHVLAAGVWIGGLAPLARLLRVAGRPEGADARPFAVLTARRFSALALGAVAVIVATGAWNAWVEVGDVAGLVGTRYGHLLLLKLTLLVPIVCLGAFNRRRLVPALGGEAETVGRPAMRRLGATVGTETLFGLAILAIVAGLAETPPARHVPPTWPLPFRLSWVGTVSLPGGRLRVLLGVLLMALGLAVALAGTRRGQRRAALLIAAASTLLAAVVALPPLLIDAYPTTYRRAPGPWAAPSIAAGERLFALECAVCHGPRAGDLAGGWMARHTEGDLFWLVSRGFPGGRMPAFADRLAEESRWDIVDFIRASAAARALGRLGPEVEPSGGRVLAPDFSVAVGPGLIQSLSDYRGRRVVLLVLFSLPESRPRIDQIARGYPSLVAMGAEVIAVPLRPSPDILRRLGASPPVFFPVATDGGGEIVSTYELFRPAAARTPHLEFLIDRRGFVRARIAPDPAVPPGLGALLGEIERLNAEPQPAVGPEEHFH
jgi:putative copper resistance protein D